MAIRRYSRTASIRGGIQLATPRAIQAIRSAANNGNISLRRHVVQGSERLDIIAGRELGDARNWWIIAAASNIGWALQVPQGTVLNIPTNLSQISDIIE